MGRKNSINLDEVIDEFTPYVKKVIDNMVGNNLSYEDKEEILTDTFFILWKNRNSEIKYLDSYIAGIAKNLVKEKFKKCNITYNIEDYENVLDLNNADLFSEQRMRINSLEINYNSLNEVEIRILNLFYYEDKPIKSIAKELNLSEINVKTKLHRIRRNIKKELAKGE